MNFEFFLIDFLFYYTETFVQFVYSVLSLIADSFINYAWIRLCLLFQSLYRVFGILLFVTYAWEFDKSALHCLHSFR